MKRVVLLSCLLLVACASNKVIPIAYNCPRVTLPPDPIPATKTLNAKSTPGDVMKAWVATAYAYRGWNMAVRRQVETSK